MAGQAAGAVTSAVIGGVTDRALSTVMRKLRSGSRPAATDEKLQRLETLVLKLRCAVEVSEKHAIASASLLEWRERLRKAAEEGGAVVLDFQRRAREAEEDKGEAAATRAPGQQRQQPAGAGASTSNLYFTRSALCGMAQRVRDATRRLFSTDEDMQKLDSALEKMEELSPDMTQFLMALQLEVTGPRHLGQRLARKRKAIPAERPKKKSIVEQCDSVEFKWRCDSVEFRWSSRGTVTMWDSMQIPSMPEAVWEKTQQLASAAEDPEREARILASKLEPTLRRMDGYISCVTNGSDMESFKWLAEWAAVLRVAVERGNAVLPTLRPGSERSGAGGGLEEDGELYSFARAVEQLALEEPCFTVLLDICPAIININSNIIDGPMP